ncbi:MAG: hypothetical protein EOP45_10285 [Sphingobacteriaceae bacterium]|nr:MAG: hypothetical protein EOP45_10285 [Sphingobacteriaceae bacterium]
MKSLYATDKYTGETGFPQAITKENATYESPTSSSYNLHISMVKEWNSSREEEKDQIIQGTISIFHSIMISYLYRKLYWIRETSDGPHMPLGQKGKYLYKHDGERLR